MKNTSVWSDYKLILWTALLLRLIAAVFSQGYGWHDDHFLVIEASGSWVEGYDYNKWLPWNPANNGPEGHSFTYVGLNFFLFYLLKLIGIVDPKIMMLVARLVHALFSILTVIYGIKITEKLSNQRTARIVGWLLAALWIMPFMSVRQLFEFTPIPLLMMGIWFLMKNEAKTVNFLVSGLLMGLALSFRYQIGVFAIGVAIVYFFQWKWKPFFLFCAGVLITFVITQGLVDFIIWGYPFAEMLGYTTYNMNEGTEYMKNINYFMYFYVLVGSLLVPLGLLVFWGFFKLKKEYLILFFITVLLLLFFSWYLPQTSFALKILRILPISVLIFSGIFKLKREYLLLFVPVLLFLLFHSLYPNRQERFILTVLPLFIILGVIGFQLLKKEGLDSKLWKYSWITFWILNIPLLILATTMYSKKSRVEAMYSIYESSATLKNVLIEGTTNGDPSMLPRFYSKDWAGAYIERRDTSQSLRVIDNVDFDYIFFFDEERLEQRIAEYKSEYPDMTLHKKCYPSNLDVLLRRMNPRNKNEYIEVWKTNRN